MSDKYEEHFCYKEGNFKAAKDKCVRFIHACMITEAVITCCSSFSDGFPENQCRYREFIFKIKIRKDRIEKFESIAQLKLEEPPQVNL